MVLELEKLLSDPDTGVKKAARRAITRLEISHTNPVSKIQ